MGIDHIGFNLTDFAAAKDFFVESLKPLGIDVVSEGEGWAMVGRAGKPSFWFGSFGGSPGPIHVAFTAETREQVHPSHAAAIAAGGKDNGGPGPRPSYHPDYDAAFVHGPDGHNIEAVCHATGET